MVGSKGLNIRVREYSERDKGILSKIAFKAFMWPQDAVWAIWGLDSRDITYVAEINGIPVGAIELETFYFKEREHGYIYYIFVDPEYWGCGVGTALMKRAEKYFKSEGICDVWGTTWSKNYRMRRLFEKNGYKLMSREELRKSMSRREFKSLLWNLYAGPGEVIYWKRVC